MAFKTAIIYTTNTKNESKLQFQYLSEQLNNINISAELISVSSNSSSLITSIRNVSQRNLIFLISEDRKFISEVLLKITDEKLVIKKDTVTKFEKIMNSTPKLAIPNTSKIFQFHNRINDVSPICINIENVFVLPCDFHSIQVIFENCILPFILYQNDDTYIGKRFILQNIQNGLSNTLTSILNTISESVQVINYCVVKNDTSEQNVIMYSSNFSKLTKCIGNFKTCIPKNLIMRESLDDSFWQRMDVMKNENFVQQAIQVLTNCYSEYEPDTIFLSFNGGKDCTVLLYLTLYVLKTMYPGYKEPLLCLYIQSSHPFAEVTEFIEQCQLIYHMELVTINNKVREGLAEIMKQRPHLKACVMGTRRTDPFAEKLHHFEMCDPGWPEIMRVSPILDWKYAEVWKFLLTCKIPYCSLYDIGYTSLGSTTNTIPNPDLKCTDASSGLDYHKPAFKLTDENKERSGRLKK